MCECLLLYFDNEALGRLIKGGLNKNVAVLLDNTPEGETDNTFA